MHISIYINHFLSFWQLANPSFYKDVICYVVVLFSTEWKLHEIGSNAPSKSFLQEMS